MEAPQNRPWLIMCYMAGGGGLAEEMVLSLQDLMREGPPKKSIIVAQFDPSGSGLETQRYVFEKASEGALERHRDKKFVGYDVNTGSAEALAQFMQWAIKEHDDQEKRNWMLVLSGHGGGTSDDFLLKEENTRDALSMDELKTALRLGTAGREKKKVDILGMDACFMSMGEVAYQVREYADTLVGAEGLEPAFGWPYRRLLARAKNGSPRHRDRKKLARMIVREYVEHYADYDRAVGRSADLAAIDLQKLTPVRRAFGALVGELERLDAAGHNRLLLAHWYAQTYKFEQFVDLWDLCAQIKLQFPDSSPVCDRSGEVITALNDCRISSGVSGFAYQYSRGLSIYFPWACVSPGYLKLEFAKVTKWGRFLQKHVEVTRRPSRLEYRREGDVHRRQRLMQLKKDCSGHRKPRSDDDADIRRQFAAILGTPVLASASRDNRLSKVIENVACTDIDDRDVPGEITRRFFKGATFGEPNSRYTGGASRYTGGASKYTGGASKYTGGASRSSEDRELSFKNLPPGIGTAFDPPLK